MSVNILLLLVIALVSYQGFKNRSLQLKLSLHPYIMKRDKSQWYRLLSSAFVHADMNHLIFNGITLYFFGGLLEQVVGPLHYLILFLGGVVFGNLPSIIQFKDKNNYFSLGASGGVSSLLFAFIFLYPTELIYLFFFIPIPSIIFGLLFVAHSFYAHFKLKDGINHLAHLAGAAFGLLWIWFI